MVDFPQEVELTPERLALVERAAGDGLPDVLHELTEGSRLIEWKDGTVAVVRTEQSKTGRTFVFVGVTGRDIQDKLADAKELARLNRCQKIRTHTSHDGVVKKLVCMGMKPVETVLEIEV